MTLQNHNVLPTVRDTNETYNYVVDPQKVLNLIGVGHLSDWVAAIDHALNTGFCQTIQAGGETDGSGQAKSAEFLLQVRPNDTLKNVFIMGWDCLYIPGSSIKGALRTAILARAGSRFAGCGNKR